MNKRKKSLHQFRKTTSSEDFYPTESRFVDALLDNQKFIGPIWEPCCGEGDISKQLKLRGHKVESTELFKRGYGKTGVDFLKKTSRLAPNIVTNPPFIHFDAFFNKSWELATNKIAFISGVPNLASSKSRYRDLWSVYKPTKIIVCLDKMFVRGSGKSIFNHCWIVWDKKSKNHKTEFIWHLLDTK